MAALIEEEGLDEEGRFVNRRYQQERRRKQAKKISDKDGDFLKSNKLLGRIDLSLQVK